MKTIISLFVLLCSACTHAFTWEEKVVASVIMGEARGEGRKGMIAVAEVIRQRSIERSQRPVTVVLSKGEFSSKNGKTTDAMIARYSRLPEFSTALEVAHMVVTEPQKLPGITKQANYFENKHKHPWWAASGVKVAVIGNHAFYRVTD